MLGPFDGSLYYRPRFKLHAIPHWTPTYGQPRALDPLPTEPQRQKNCNVNNVSRQLACFTDCVFFVFSIFRKIFGWGGKDRPDPPLDGLSRGAAALRTPALFFSPLTTRVPPGRPAKN